MYLEYLLLRPVDGSDSRGDLQLVDKIPVRKAGNKLGDDEVHETGMDAAIYLCV